MIEYIELEYEHKPRPEIKERVQMLLKCMIYDMLPNHASLRRNLLDSALKMVDSLENPNFLNDVLKVTKTSSKINFQSYYDLDL